MSVELARLDAARSAMPALVSRYDDVLDAPDAARQLWRRACHDVQQGCFDDRPLYWARLKLLRGLRGARSVAQAERDSRGFGAAPVETQPIVLVTGFDPFHLQRDIGQSNPSGLAALALDGATVAGSVVRSAIFPVRFADFDRGYVEQVLTPIFRRMPRLVLTVSMGRDRFDLERFPGRRRSTTTLDNRGQPGGGSDTAPLPPADLAGPEFLEFSLPAASMKQAPGRWEVRNNGDVRTLERGAVTVGSLSELSGATAVQGSGGGFLSNEIAYRCLLLQQRLGVRFPLGHLHTPAVRGYDESVERAIVDQIKRVLVAALASDSSARDKADLEASRSAGTTQNVPSKKL